MCHIYKSSLHQKQAKGEDLFEKLFVSRSRLDLSSTLGELASIFDTYLLKNCFFKIVLVTMCSATSQYPVFDKYREDQSLKIMLGGQKKYLSITFLSVNKRRKYELFLEDSS